MNIAILALQELFDTGLFVTLDALKLANQFSATQFGGTPHFEVTVVGVRTSVRSGQGISVPVKPITPALKPDWVVVPALSAGTPEQLVPALKREDVSDAKAQLQHLLTATTGPMGQLTRGLPRKACSTRAALIWRTLVDCRCHRESCVKRTVSKR